MNDKKIFVSSILLAILFITCFNNVKCNNGNKNINNTSKIYVAPWANSTEITISLQNPRNSRIMKFLQNSKPLLRRTKIPGRIQSRADNFSPRPLNSNFNINPMFSLPQPPQNLRHKQNSVNVASPYYRYDSVKSSRYSPVKQITGPNAGKLSPYRIAQPQYVNTAQGVLHPNTMHIGPGTGKQFNQNFKASPPYNGKVIVHQIEEERKSSGPQHPNPNSQTGYQLSERFPQQLNNLNQREKYSFFNTVVPSKSELTTGDYTFTTVKPYFKPAQNYNHYPSPGYSVYEDDESVHIQKDQDHQVRAIKNSFQRDESDSSVAKEAKEYLKFMSTNEYFLPKREPNYKQMDAEQNQKGHQQLFIQQAFTNKPKPSQSLFDKSLNSREHIQVSNLFHHNDPASSPTIIHGTYNGANNAFVVTSDDSLAVNHFIPDVPKVTTTATPPNRYMQNRQHTPEPQRFEFTERDAVSNSHTKPPYSYLRYKAVNPPLELRPKESETTQTLSSTASPIINYNMHSTPTPSSYGINRFKSVNELATDDTEDSDDIRDPGDSEQANNSEAYGRIQLRNSDSPSRSEAPNEQKDTEDYCEHICANVQDDDEDVVCGSDGFMYTSEAQLECYASCLHIEVSIQGKGSCSAR